MKISTKSRYALQALAYMAKRDKVCSIHEISCKENIPNDYLGKLFYKLKKAGLVDVHRGAQGGYFLASTPNKITIGKIIRTLEGSTSLVSCMETKKNCRNEKSCGAKNIWKKFQKKINESLDSLTLADSF